MADQGNELPGPTEDLDRCKADIDRFGYALLANALSAPELKRLRARLEEVAAAERADGVAAVYDDDESQMINVFVNKGRPFVDLIEHPKTLPLIAHILGEHFLLSNAAALIKGPGGAAQVVHSDQTYVPEPWTYAAVGNVIWMADDFTEANGATRVVPGSHMRQTNPPGGDYTKGFDPYEPVSISPEGQPPEVFAETVPVEAPAGTALVFEGRLWHCGGANTTKDEYRHGAVTYYCRPFLRQQENFVRSISPGVLESASPTLRRLLGYDPYFVLGKATS